MDSKVSNVEHLLYPEEKHCIGRRYGMLTVIGPTFRIRSSTIPADCIKGRLVPTVVTQCDCGAFCVKVMDSLKQGINNSCGHCAKVAARTTHGGHKDRLYHRWAQIKYRCERGDPRYGGRGICVCDEWRDSYEAFRDWSLANGYRYGLTIDRIDNDGNYEPANCRWTDTITQCNNKSTNRLVTAFGETMTLTQLSRRPECVTTKFALRHRLNKGWDAEIAATTHNITGKKGINGQRAKRGSELEKAEQSSGCIASDQNTDGR